MFKIIIIIITIFFTFKLIIYPILNKRGDSGIELYIGIPGSGKTTIAAWFSKYFQNKKKDVYSNVDIKGNYILSPKDDLGIYEIYNSIIIVDEAGLEFDNRKFNTYPENCNFFFKYIGHYKNKAIILSQRLDIDIKIRDLSNRIFIVEPSFIPFFIRRKEIGKRIGIKEGELYDEYFWKFLGKRLFFAPKVWKMYNTLDRRKLIDKDFQKWDYIHCKEKEENDEK